MSLHEPIENRFMFWKMIKVKTEENRVSPSRPPHRLKLLYSQLFDVLILEEGWVHFQEQLASFAIWPKSKKYTSDIVLFTCLKVKVWGIVCRLMNYAKWCIFWADLFLHLFVIDFVTTYANVSTYCRYVQCTSGYQLFQEVFQNGRQKWVSFVFLVFPPFFIYSYSHNLYCNNGLQNIQIIYGISIYI